MRATCPSCGTGGSIELFLADTEWREAIVEAAQLPSDCAGPAMRYIGMFRPGKRFLTPDRSARLIRELRCMIVDGIDFDRQHIHAPSHIWRTALIDMLDAPGVQRPLKNHNYLLRIVQSKLGQQSDTAQAERAHTRRNETASTDRNAGMQRVDFSLSAAPKEEPKDSLYSLPVEEQRFWMGKAEESLKAGGINEKFIQKEAIEAEARALIEQQDHETKSNGITHNDDRSEANP